MLQEFLQQFESDLLIRLVNGIVSILLIGIIAVIYLNVRTNKVLLFIEDVLIDDHDLYIRLPEPRAMIWSFKALKVENWVKEKEYEERTEE